MTTISKQYPLLPSEDGGEAASDQQPEVSTRELSRYVNYYNTRIRKHSRTEMMGVFRQMQRLLAKGYTLEKFQRAMQHYEKSECPDPRLRMTLRRFFTAEVIDQWQTPFPSRRRDPERAPDPVLSVLDALDRAPAPTTPSPVTPAADDRDEEESFL